MPIIYFYPRSPCGERPTHVNISDQKTGFLSTLSLRRATIRPHPQAVPVPISIHALLAESDLVTTHVIISAHISIHALLAESDIAGARSIQQGDISIHALLAESDILGNPCAGCPAISIHALLAESDPAKFSRPTAATRFLSTLSLRRATIGSTG